MPQMAWKAVDATAGIRISTVLQKGWGSGSPGVYISSSNAAIRSTRLHMAIAGQCKCIDSGRSTPMLGLPFEPVRTVAGTTEKVPWSCRDARPS